VEVVVKRFGEVDPKVSEETNIRAKLLKKAAERNRAARDKQT